MQKSYLGKITTGGLIASFVLVVPCMLLSAFTLMQLWNWFLVPAFSSGEKSLIPVLTLPIAFGLNLLIGWLRTRVPTHELPDEMKYVAWFRYMVSICVDLGTLATAWVFHHYILS